MQTEASISMTNIRKQFRNFELCIPSLEIPKGFATALVGENGAGKSTLLNILAGIRLDYEGNVEFWGGEKDEKIIREAVGYTAPGAYFMPHWTGKAIAEVSSLLFDNFHAERFEEICKELGVEKLNKKVSQMSDGMRMKTTLATVFARDTKVLLLDEPASPLDPLMRDKLCNMIREYLEEGADEKSVFFSTHNISDMENVTDYCIIMEQGRVAEQGFVEDLKEKYVMVKGEAADAESARKYLIGFQKNSYGFEGLCKTDDLDCLAGLDIAAEQPTLSQISVCIMKQHSKLS
jgi:ABC-2 type transport system ATP-binding protein